MKRYKIYNKVLGLAVAALTLTACADTWDDHYAQKSESANDASLWQAIKQDSKLSNFAKVVEACGYDKALNSSQVFTVFAPVNDNFSTQEADELIAAYNAEKGKVNDDDNTVIKEFIQNHIAMYNHSISDTSNDTLMLMNGKKTLLTSSTINDSPILSKNQHYNNGILFTIQNKSKYFPNVFEYLKKDADLDSIANFFYNSRFYRKEFVPERSVAGGLENGKTVYLDSVFVQQNDLWDMLWAYTNSEDSTYWMVVPTNQEWKKLIEEYEPYFNYADNTPFRDSMAYTMPRMAIVGGTTFSRTLNTDKHLTDSAMSTMAEEEYVWRESMWGSKNLHYYQFGTKSDTNTQKPYSENGIFNGTDNIKCSNGQIMKSNDWKINKLNTFNQWIIIEAEDSRSIKEVSKTENSTTKEKEPDITAVIREVENDNDFYNKLWSNEFVEFVQNKTTVEHSVTFNIRDVLSNIGYDIYVVSAPAVAYDEYATEADRIPTKMKTTINYRDQSGAEVSKALNTVSTNGEIVDYILLAEDFKFPTATYGLTETEPQITLTLKTSVTAPELRQKKFSRTMRIDCIMLVPHGISNVDEERFEITPHGDGDTFQWPKY